MAQPPLKTLTVSKKFKFMHPLRSTNPTSRYVPYNNECIILKKDLCRDVDNSCIHN